MTTQKQAGMPLNTLLLLAAGDDSSENEPAWPPPSWPVTRTATRKASPTLSKTRPARNLSLTASSASTSESRNAPKAKPAVLSKKKREQKDLLCLESLLDGTAKSLNSGRKTNKEIAAMVGHDLAELERRQLGGVASSESSDDEVENEDVDEAVHERVLGAEQAGMVSRMLKSDRGNIVKVTPWRPFWATDNGSSGEAMDTTVNVARFFGSRRLTIV
jgi:hypothetical protein